MKSMSYIIIVLILSCFTLAQLDPGNLSTEEEFKQVNRFLSGFASWYKDHIKGLGSQLPEGNQIMNRIDQEMENLYICLRPNQDELVMYFRPFWNIYYYLGGDRSNYLYANYTYLSELFFKMLNAVVNYPTMYCMNDSIIIAPFMSKILGTVTRYSIEQFLIDLRYMTDTINERYIPEFRYLISSGCLGILASTLSDFYILQRSISLPIHVNPVNMSDMHLWIFLKETVNGFMNYIKYLRKINIFFDPNEYQLWQSIANEMNMIKSCFNDNPIPIVSVFRHIGPVLEFVGAQDYKYETTNIYYLAMMIYVLVNEGIQAIGPCATSSSIVMPYLNEIKNQVTIMSIYYKLDEKRNQTIEISNFLQLISIEFDSWNVYSSGENLAKLYLIFNPLDLSQNPAYTTAKIMLHIDQILNGFIDKIIQTRQDKNYNSNPNESMIAQKIRNEAFILLNCIQNSDPESLANTFRMFANPFATLGAPFFNFENADKYTLAKQIHNIWECGYYVSRYCLTETPTIQFFFDSLHQITSGESFHEKLNSLINRSDKINEHLQAVMLHFNRGEFFSAGVYFGILWFIANPLDEYHQLRSSSSNDVTVNGIAVARAEVLMNLYSADNALLKTITLSNNY